MPRLSAGLVLYRYRGERLEVFLVHPGGPFWARRDLGTWTIPKGEVAANEDAFAAAQREFQEETGIAVSGAFIPLEPVKQKGGKIVQAWAAAGDCDAERIRSNLFSIEWPPGSGKQKEFPEIDRAAFFEIEEAKRKINPAQAALLSELQRKVKR